MSKRRRERPGSSPPAPVAVPGGGPPRPKTVEEQAHGVLDAVPQLQNIEALGDECWVFACTAMHPVFLGVPKTHTVTLTDKPQSVTIPISANDPIGRILNPPNGTVAYRFTESDERRAIHGLFLGAKRVRNCLAFLTGVPIPLVYAIASRRFLWRSDYRIDDPMRYHPEVSNLDSDTEPQWHDILRSAYVRAEQLLRDINPMAPLGRAISLVGDSLWTVDHEESFLYAWRAIDLVAKLDYRAAKSLAGEARAAAMAEYASVRSPSAPPIDECCRGPGDLPKILVTLGRRVGKVDSNRIRELHGLRGAIAHDTVDVDQFKRVLDGRPEAIQLAIQVVRFAIDSSGVDSVEKAADRAGG